MNRVPATVVAAVVTAGVFGAPAHAGFGLRIAGGPSYILHADYNDHVDFNNGTMFPRLGVSGTMEKIHCAADSRSRGAIREAPRITTA